MTINDTAKQIDEWCNRKGWNEKLIIGNMIANLHSEISEAWEEIRNGKHMHEVYFEGEKPCGFGIELADLAIRLFHITAHFDIDLEKLIAQKMQYNETREYRHGGKTA